MVCPPGHWEAVYSNINPWGLGELNAPRPLKKQKRERLQDIWLTR